MTTRRRIAPFAIPALVVGMALDALGMGPADARADSWPQLQMSAPEEHVFTAIRHFRYRERLYDPPLTIQPFEQPPDFHDGPEAVLRAQVSAAKALDYDRWLDTWDATSRARMEAQGMTAEGQRERWRAAWDGTHAVMVRWVLFRDYVIIGYRLAGKEAAGEERARAFKLDGGRWVATLDLEPDPGAANFLKGGRMERRVR